MKTNDNKILKINRHLFDNGTKEINRVLRTFVPRGSNPRLCWLQNSCKELLCIKTKKEEEQSRNAQAKIKLARQGIPFVYYVQTQLVFP